MLYFIRRIYITYITTYSLNEIYIFLTNVTNKQENKKCAERKFAKDIYLMIFFYILIKKN